MIPARLIIGIAALVCASVCGIASSLVTFEMVDKVNERLPEEQQFALLGRYWSKRQRLHREYKRLYPDGGLLRRLRTLVVLACSCLLICVLSFGLLAW
jgi:hypothetical protein